MSVQLTETAQANFRALIEWLAERSPKATRKAIMALVLALDRLDTFNEAGPATDDEQRQLTVRFGRDGFLVQYRVEGDQVIVEAILHGLQNR